VSDGQTCLTIEARLLAAVGAVVGAGSAGRVIVAYSGGLDSSVLLAAAARCGRNAAIEALHIDHGWHSDSKLWSAQCIKVSAELGLVCRVERLDAPSKPGLSLEEAAREARYRAFERWLEPGDTLLTAHHGDDQLETMLMRVLRGSGVRGLRAIHTDGALGRGRCSSSRARSLRPLPGPGGSAG